jgi:AAA+ ATPase superfamily predicted ATPase
MSCEFDLPSISFIVGRETELNIIVSALTCKVRAWIAILGPPRIGETTLATAVLHHREVEARYPLQCYFVECDSIKSVDTLLLQMTKVLRIPLQGGDQDL